MLSASVHAKELVTRHRGYNATLNRLINKDAAPQNKAAGRAKPASKEEVTIPNCLGDNANFKNFTNGATLPLRTWMALLMKAIEAAADRGLFVKKIIQNGKEKFVNEKLGMMAQTYVFQGFTHDSRLTTAYLLLAHGKNDLHITLHAFVGQYMTDFLNSLQDDRREMAVYAFIGFFHAMCQETQEVDEPEYSMPWTEWSTIFEQRFKGTNEDYGGMKMNQLALAMREWNAFLESPEEEALTPLEAAENMYAVFQQHALQIFADFNNEGNPNAWVEIMQSVLSSLAQPNRASLQDFNALDHALAGCLRTTKEKDPIKVAKKLHSMVGKANLSKHFRVKKWPENMDKASQTAMKIIEAFKNTEERKISRTFLRKYLYVHFIYNDALLAGFKDKLKGQFGDPGYKSKLPVPSTVFCITGRDGEMPDVQQD